MNRINVYAQGDYETPHEYQGWFDLDSATEIASYSTGPWGPGYTLLATARGKLVVNIWGAGSGHYRFADDEKEIAEILSRGGYDGDEAKLKEILDKYEL